MTPSQRTEALRLADELEHTLSTTAPHTVAALLRTLAEQAQPSDETREWERGRAYGITQILDGLRDNPEKFGVQPIPKEQAQPAHEPLTEEEIKAIWWSANSQFRSDKPTEWWLIFATAVLKAQKEKT